LVRSDRPRSIAPYCAGLPIAGSRPPHRPNRHRQQCNRRFACPLTRLQSWRLTQAICQRFSRTELVVPCECLCPASNYPFRNA
jgi:hypothetical protein